MRSRGRLVFLGLEALRRGPLLALHDSVLLVGSSLDLADAAEKLRRLGVEAAVYPLHPLDAPTLYSALGVAAWLRHRAAEGDVAVVGTGVALVESIYSAVYGTGEPRWSELQSPLQLRLVEHLEVLRSHGVDLAMEAERHLADAFSGGDAYRSDIVQRALDIAYSLGRLSCSPFLYRSPWGAGRLPASCRSVYEAARSLDPEGGGAVGPTALRVGGGVLEVVVGCRLLLSAEECWPEFSSAEPWLHRLASEIGATKVKARMAPPEEAACLLYGSRVPSMCGGIVG